MTQGTNSPKKLVQQLQQRHDLLGVQVDHKIDSLLEKAIFLFGIYYQQLERTIFSNGLWLPVFHARCLKHLPNAQVTDRFRNGVSAACRHRITTFRCRRKLACFLVVQEKDVWCTVALSKGVYKKQGESHRFEVSILACGYAWIGFEIDSCYSWI